MELHRIEYFLTLANTLNFNQAAREIGISAPALTKQIKLLEEELGMQLFERTTRSVSLTEEGVICFNQFSNLKAHYDEVMGMLSDVVRMKSKIVRIGFFTPLPKEEFVNPLIHALSTQFPEIDFHISTDQIDDLKEQVKNGDIDIAITNSNDFHDWIGCERVIFKTMPAEIVISEEHLWAREGKKQIRKEDMEAGDILLLLKKGSYEFNSFYAKVKTRTRTIVPDFETMLIELEKGKCFAVFPRIFDNQQRSRFLFFDLPEEFVFRYHTLAAMRSANRNPDVIKVFRYLKQNKEQFAF